MNQEDFIEREEIPKEMLKNIFDNMKEVYDYFKIETVKGRDGNYYADYEEVNYRINELYNHGYANAILADALYKMNKIIQILDEDTLADLFIPFKRKYTIFKELTSPKKFNGEDE